MTNVATKVAVVVVLLEKKVCFLFSLLFDLDLLLIVEWPVSGYCDREIKQAIIKEASVLNTNYSRFTST